MTFQVTGELMTVDSLLQYMNKTVDLRSAYRTYVGTERLVANENDQITTVIGALVTLTATSPNGPIQSVQWTIQDRQNTVANNIITKFPLLTVQWYR